MVRRKKHAPYVAGPRHVLEWYNMPTRPRRRFTENRKESACSGLEMNGNLVSGWENESERARWCQQYFSMG